MLRINENPHILPGSVGKEQDTIFLDPPRKEQDPVFPNNQKIIPWAIELGIPIIIHKIIYPDRVPSPTYYRK